MGMPQLEKKRSTFYIFFGSGIGTIYCEVWL